MADLICHCAGIAGKSLPSYRRPSKEKAGNLIKDFLLGGAAGGQLAFGCKGSGQHGARRGDGVIHGKLLLNHFYMDK